MPDSANKPRRSRGKLLLQSAAITTSTLLVWCNRAGEDSVIYANPKGSTYDVPSAEPTVPLPPDVPDTSATATQPTGENTAKIAADAAPDAGPTDAGAPDAKAPPRAPLAPPRKPIIYSNPKGSFYEDLGDDSRDDFGAGDRKKPSSSGPGSARG